MIDRTVAERLERWSRSNALLLLASTILASCGMRLWPLGAAILPSFVLLVGQLRWRWTPTRAFGWANAVTAVRLLLVMALSTVLRNATGPTLAFVTLCTFALDGLDGWLALRNGSTSPFGAHFDMEVDAAFVLVLTELLWQRQVVGIWILAPGLLRYLYVLWKWALPEGSEARPRTEFGRVAFSTLVVGMASAFVLPKPFGTVATGIGALLVAISFARSFYWCWVSAMNSRATVNQSRLDQ